MRCTEQSQSFHRFSWTRRVQSNACTWSVDKGCDWCTFRQPTSPRTLASSGYSEAEGHTINLYVDQASSDPADYAQSSPLQEDTDNMLSSGMALWSHFSMTPSY